MGSRSLTAAASASSTVEEQRIQRILNPFCNLRGFHFFGTKETSKVKWKEHEVTNIVHPILEPKDVLRLPLSDALGPIGLLIKCAAI